MRTPSHIAQEFETTVTIRCLGQFGVLGKDGWISGREANRGKQFIGYLAVHSHSIAQRQTLIDAFWPDGDIDTVAHRLHLVVSGARATLRKAQFGIETIVCVDGGYKWHPRIRVESDASQLLELEKSTDENKWRQASGLYKGEFLADQEGDWLIPIRMRCAAAYSSLLERHAESLYTTGNYWEALDRGFELIEIDPAYEASSRFVMRCFGALNRPLQACEVFAALERFLEKRLAVQPTRETVELLDEIVRVGRVEQCTCARHARPAGSFSEEDRPMDARM
jgi:DNA-binding SARP family transcriptional activator